MLGSGKTDQGHFYYAVPVAGQKLYRALGRKGGEPAFHLVLRLCGDGAAIFAALGAAEVALPDARLDRFDLEGDSRLSLVDLQGAEPRDADKASKEHLELARGFFRAVLERSRYRSADSRLLRVIDRAGSLAELRRMAYLTL